MENLIELCENGEMSFVTVEELREKLNSMEWYDEDGDLIEDANWNSHDFSTTTSFTINEYSC